MRRHLLERGFLALLACAAGLTPAAPLHAADLVVSAAISLADAFGRIGHAFESLHPDTHVVLNLGASDVLLQQMAQGAPADVFASADEASMDRAAARGLIVAATRRDFATNTLVLIVPNRTAAMPTTLSDLRSPAYARIAIGNPASVPAGRYARGALRQSGVWDALQPRLVFAENVRQALEYVARGEAQAGLVYATDAAIEAGRVRIASTVPTAAPVRYPAAVARRSADAARAAQFVAFLGSAAAHRILARYGFGVPAP